MPGELIVRFKAGVDAREQADTLAERGARVADALPLRGVKVVRLPRGVAVPAAAAALERDPDVLYAEPNFIRRLAARLPNDPGFGNLWALNSASDRDIDAPEAWGVTTGSEGVVVAVVDSGIDYGHPDLVANAWANPRESVNGADDDGNGLVDDVRGWDFVQEDAAPLDENNHGTHVAGTIGARGNNSTGVVGVSWTVKLMPVRAADKDGYLTDSDVIDAFHYAGRTGARVVNASFGGSGFSTAMLNAIEAYPNTLFVAAAGNGGSDGVGDNNDLLPQYPCNFASLNLVCVAATDTGDGLAGFSNFGALSVDLGAPGVDILSTLRGGGYGSGSGTSMATPQVSGAAALALAANPGLTATQVVRVVLSTVDTVSSLTAKVATGGRLNAFRAVAAVGSPPPAQTGPVSPPPPAPAPAPAPAPPPAPAPAPAPTSPPALDGSPPNTRITSAPARRTTSRRALFRFVSSEAGSAFQCRIDRGLWRPCASPRSYRLLKRGLHTFRVRAKDRAGNVDATPATRVWRIS